MGAAKKGLAALVIDGMTVRTPSSTHMTFVNDLEKATLSSGALRRISAMSTALLRVPSPRSKRPTRFRSLGMNDGAAELPNQ